MFRPSNRSADVATSRTSRKCWRIASGMRPSLASSWTSTHRAEPRSACRNWQTASRITRSTPSLLRSPNVARRHIGSGRKQMSSMPRRHRQSGASAFISLSRTCPKHIRWKVSAWTSSKAACIKGLEFPERALMQINARCLKMKLKTSTPILKPPSNRCANSLRMLRWRDNVSPASVEPRPDWSQPSSTVLTN